MGCKEVHQIVINRSKGVENLEVKVKCWHKLKAAIDHRLKLQQANRTSIVELMKPRSDSVTLLDTCLDH